MDDCGGVDEFYGIFIAKILIFLILGCSCSNMDRSYSPMRGSYLLRHLGFSFPSITGRNTKTKKRTRGLRYFILFYDLPPFVTNSEFDFYVLCLTLLDPESMSYFTRKFSSFMRLELTLKSFTSLIVFIYACRL